MNYLTHQETEMLLLLRRIIGWIPHQYTDTFCKTCMHDCDRCAIQEEITKLEETEKRRKGK